MNATRAIYAVVAITIVVVIYELYRQLTTSINFPTTAPVTASNSLGSTSSLAASAASLAATFPSELLSLGQSANITSPLSGLGNLEAGANALGYTF